MTADEIVISDQIKQNWKEAKGLEDNDNQKCINYCQKVDSLARLQPEKFADYIIRANILWADQYESLSEWDRQLKVAEKAHDEFREDLNPELLMKTTIHLRYEQCRCMDSQGKLDSAIICYKNLRDSIGSLGLKDTENFNFTIPFSIGAGYMEKRDFKNAKIWHDVADSSLHENNAFYSGYFNRQYGLYYYHYIEDVKEAEKYFKKAIKAFSKNHEETGDAALKAYMDLIDMYMEQVDLKKCVKCLEKADKLVLKKDWSYARINYQYANVFFKKQEYRNALKYIDSTFPHLDSIQKDRFYLRGKHLTLKGALLAKTGDYKKALEQFQKAFYNLNDEFNSIDFEDNPIPKFSSQKIELLKTLAKKAMVLKNGFTELPNKLSYLQSAVETNKVAIDLIQLLRTDYNDDQTKELLSNNWFGVFESAIESAYLYYDTTGERPYLEKAFEFSETGKALSLLENLQDINAKEIANMPDSLIEQEYQFKSDILILENRLANEKNEANKSIFKKRLSNKRRAFENWKDSLKINHPEYYKLKYDIKIATVKDVQENLQPNETLIEYFYGEKNIYVFTISKTGFNIRQISVNDSFEKDLGDFVKLTRKKNLSGTDIPNYVSIGTHLYNQLIQPSNVDSNKITIIPDGKLHELSFAALPTHDSLSDDPKRLSYLIEKNIIDYHFSASVMMQHQQNKKEESINESLLVIAPIEFPPGLSSLEMAKDSLTMLANSGVHINFLETPDKDTVLAELKKGYRYVFFFSHGEALDNIEPFVHLRNDSLFLSEIYSSEINAQSVFLTACVTGRGKNKRGEGVMSLARGFAYQNVPNAVMTLWEPEEKASRDISLDFLQYHIVDKKSPAEALRQAQLDLLRAGSSHDGIPYEWAGLVVVGK